MSSSVHWLQRSQVLNWVIWNQYTSIFSMRIFNGYESKFIPGCICFDRLWCYPAFALYIAASPVYGIHPEPNTQEPCISVPLSSGSRWVSLTRGGRWEEGKRRLSSLFSLPIVPRAPSFSFSPVSPQHKEAFAEERVSVPLTDSSFGPSDQHQFSPNNVNTLSRETGPKISAWCVIGPKLAAWCVIYYFHNAWRVIFP